MVGHGVGELLLAAVGGYWVIERAQAHKGQLKKVGQFLGALIIVISLVDVACRAWCLIGGARGYCQVGKTGKGWHCPYTSKSPSSAPLQEELSK